MTKRERAQVVELLRCAADEYNNHSRLNGMFTAAYHLDPTENVHLMAWRLVDAITLATLRLSLVPRVQGRLDELYRYRLLEAAARLEEQP